jgi:hypothetical protein
MCDEQCCPDNAKQEQEEGPIGVNVEVRDFPDSMVCYEFSAEAEDFSTPSLFVAAGETLARDEGAGIEQFVHAASLSGGDDGRLTLLVFAERPKVR